MISLHKQATTTPKTRAAIQASDEPAWVLADRYGISEQTVWKWRNRDGILGFVVGSASEVLLLAADVDGISWSLGSLSQCISMPR